MKKILFLISLVGSLFASEYTNINGELRAFSFDRSFDNNTPNSKAVTAGGIIKYDTQSYNNISASVGYYGSFNTGAYNDTTGKDTSLLTNKGGDIAFLGEANLKYDNGEEQVIIGRQRLSTPLANDHDLRLLPSTYQGVTAMYKPYGIQIGRITDHSGFGSKYNGFQSKEFSYIWISKFDANLQYIHSDLTDYYYADYMYKIGSLIARAQIGGNDSKFELNSFMYGAKLTYQTSYADVSILGNEIKHNNFKAIESGAMYSDWMQGYGLYEPSKAYGFQIAKSFSKFNTTIGAVKVCDGIIDDYTEYQADAIYQINKANKIRVRYSEKDQTQQSRREDRSDTRVIYYMAF